MCLIQEFEDEYGKHIESSKKNGNDIAKRMKEGLESVLKNKIHTVEVCLLSCGALNCTVANVLYFYVCGIH